MGHQLDEMAEDGIATLEVPKSMCLPTLGCVPPYSTLKRGHRALGLTWLFPFFRTSDVGPIKNSFQRKALALDSSFSFYEL